MPETGEKQMTNPGLRPEPDESAACAVAHQFLQHGVSEHGALDEPISSRLSG